MSSAATTSPSVDKVDGFSRKSVRKAKQKRSQSSSQFRSQGKPIELTPLPLLKGKTQQMCFCLVGLTGWEAEWDNQQFELQVCLLLLVQYVEEELLQRVLGFNRKQLNLVKLIFVAPVYSSNLNVLTWNKNLKLL